MKTHTSAFKTNIKKFGRELDSIITFTLNNEEVELGNENLNSVTPHYEGTILKSVMKQLDIDSNVDIPIGTEVNYQFGIKVSDNAVQDYRDNYEYLDYGNYIVYSSEKQEDTNSYKIICYDKMLYSMVDYVNIGVTYPITIRNYISAICTHLGLTFANSSDTFANYDKEIPNELYLSSDGTSLDYTFRDVLDELAEVTASTICINDDDELEIRYITSTNDTIDEEYLKDINVNFGEKFGPVNVIVLNRSAGSDNVYYPTVLPQSPYELKISDNQIMNGNNRSDFLPDIYTVLNGLEYYTNDFTSTGICYYDLCDRYNVTIGENTYSCVMFNDEVNVTQGLEEHIYTDLPEETETDYKKADTTDRKINQAYIIVNKQNQQIEAVTSTVSTIDMRENNNYQELLSKFDDYMPVSDFVDLENSVTQLQTDTYTKTEVNTKLTDGSVTMVSTTTGTFDENGLTIEKTNAKTKGRFNEIGMKIMDATGSSDTELLFAGYDETLNESVVRSKNINVSKYLSIGTKSRIEDYESGTGIFYIG